MRNNLLFLSALMIIGGAAILGRGLISPEPDLGAELEIEQQREELQKDDVESFDEYGELDLFENDERERAQREESNTSDAKELNKPEDTRKRWWQFWR